MRRRACHAGIVLVIASAFVTIAPAQSQDEPYPVELSAGETFNVCKSGQIVCPAITPICDDPKIVVPVDIPDGLGFRGMAPGTTFCSAASAVGPRRVFRITVR